MRTNKTANIVFLCSQDIYLRLNHPLTVLILPTGGFYDSTIEKRKGRKIFSTCLVSIGLFILHLFDPIFVKGVRFYCIIPGNIRQQNSTGAVCFNSRFSRLGATLLVFSALTILRYGFALRIGQKSRYLFIKRLIFLMFMCTGGAI
jgi:hypothetical protein